MARVKADPSVGIGSNTFREAFFCAMPETLAAVATTNGGDQL
jgi:hypothetical protein